MNVHSESYSSFKNISIFVKNNAHKYLSWSYLNVEYFWIEKDALKLRIVIKVCTRR